MSQPVIEPEPTPQASALVVNETFSIPMLERKMMFLNEPGLLNAPLRQGVDQVKQLWLVHTKQMEFHDRAKSGAASEGEEDNEDALRRDRVE